VGFSPRSFQILGIHPFGLKLIGHIAVDPVLAILSLFLLKSLLSFFPFLAAIAHIFSVNAFTGRDQLPVEMIPAFSTIRITVRSGARVAATRSTTTG
jgi:hypothetical protein